MKQSEYDELPPRPEPVAPAVQPVETPVEPAAAKVETLAGPKTYDHPRTMIKRALALGASLEEIRLTEPNNLDLWIDANETTAKVEPAAATPADPFGIDALVKENPDYDTPVLKILRKVSETSAARIAALEAENKSVKQQLQHAARNRGNDTIDDAFSTLSPEIFGKGNRSTIGADSPEAKRRLAVLASADIKKGDSDDVVKAKIKSHAEVLFGATKPATAPTNGDGTARITPEQWSKAGLPAPASRVVNEPPGINKAYDAVRALMVEKGMYADDDESAAHLRVPK